MAPSVFTGGGGGGLWGLPVTLWASQGAMGGGGPKSPDSLVGRSESMDLL